MSTINQILELLKDGSWHSLKEIAEKSGVHQSKLNVIVDFLAEYDFIHLNKEHQKAKLTPSVLDFLKKSGTLT